MKINLVIPPAPYLIDGKVFPPLGILYAASLLEKHGHKVKIIDCLNKNKFWIEKSMIRSAESNCDYIGITATTPDFPLAIHLRGMIKHINPDKKVVIGGSHSMIAPEECKKYFDMTGDELFKKLGIKEDFKEFPFPARHLINMNSYAYKIDGLKATNIISQLGCPFDCDFCSKVYPQLKQRTISNLIKELDFLNDEYGYNAFMFYDDEINLDKNRLSKLCKSLKKKGYRWRAFIRADLFTEDMAKEMKEAGCHELLCGVESGSDRILKVINKQTTSEINTGARTLCRKYGIKFKALMMIGLPSETKEDVMMTKQWLLDNKPDTFDITVYAPYPGSRIYDHKEGYDIEFNPNFQNDSVFFKGIPGKYKSHVRTSKLDYDEIVKLRDEIEREVKCLKN